MRLCTIGIPFFQHDGLAVGSGWTPFDYATADKLARTSFRDHAGRFVRIHPDDVGELTGFGLTLDNGRVVPIERESSAGRGLSAGGGEEKNEQRTAAGPKPAGEPKLAAGPQSLADPKPAAEPRPAAESKPAPKNDEQKSGGRPR